jgi:hypothetical protein
MFFPTLLPGRARISKLSSRQCRRASSLRTGTFKPLLETLEDRTILSTIAYQMPAGTAGNQTFGGPLGMDFDVKQNVVVDELGVFDSGSDGLAVPLTARLYNRDSRTQVASLSFAAGQTGTLIGGSRFLPLATPVILPAGFHGTIVAEGYGIGEPNGNGGLLPPPQTITWTTDDGGGLLQFVGGGRSGSTPGAFPANVDSGPANRYAAGTFSFSALGPIASGPASVLTGDPYTLSLTPPPGLAVSSWAVSWGDGQTDTLPGGATQATHTYVTAGSYAIAATAYSSAPGALGTSFSSAVLADAPAAYWRLDETSPAQPAHDQVGGNDAAYQNFTATDLGLSGALRNGTSTSVQFNGVDHYLSLPDVFNCPTNGTTTTQYAVSFSAWFNTTTGGVILGQTDASTSPGGAAPSGWVPAVYVGADGRVFASLFWHGPGGTLLSSSGSYNDGAWHQVTDVYDHGVETLYLDGNPVAAQAIAVVGYAAFYRYALGAGYTTTWPDTTGGWSFFNGRLDEAAVYRGALSGQQVAAQYLAGTSAGVAVTVGNALPTAAILGAPASSPEGTAIRLSASVVDPSTVATAAGFTYAWSVTEDGNPYTLPAGTVTNAASFTFTPADNGSYVVSLAVTDKDNGTGTASSTISVTNVAPANVSLSLSAGTINENASVGLSGRFTDPGILDTHTVVISWGDGSANTTLNLGAGVLSFGGVSHQYLDNPAGRPNGSFPISVMVTDKDGDSGSGSTSVQVNNVAPTLTVAGNQVANTGAATSFHLGRFTDPGTQDTWTVTVNWGDGTPATVIAMGNTQGTIPAQLHAYAANGTYTVTVTVQDDDGGQDVKTFQVAVAAPAAISANFNGTALAAGNYLWFSSVLTASGLSKTADTTIWFVGQTITLGGTILPVPNASITFHQGTGTSSTAFSAGAWHTDVYLGSGLSGNQFLSGLAYHVPAALAGGIKNVTWSGRLFSDQPGVSLNWKWAAAVYTALPTVAGQPASVDYTAMLVKPVDDTKTSVYQNSDHAGTPEGYAANNVTIKSEVIGGGTGGGGANWTGGYSGTDSVLTQEELDAFFAQLEPGSGL